MVREAQAFQNWVYAMWSVHLEKAELRVIPVFFSAAGVVIATWLLLGIETVLAFSSSEMVNLQDSLSWLATRVLSSVLLPKSLKSSILRHGAFFLGTFAAHRLFEVLFSMLLTWASSLLNATSLLIVWFIWLVALIATSRTHSSIRASMSSPLVTLSILFLLSYTSTYPRYVGSTDDIYSLSSTSKHASLSSPALLFYSPSALVSYCPSFWSSSSSLHSLV